MCHPCILQIIRLLSFDERKRGIDKLTRPNLNQVIINRVNFNQDTRKYFLLSHIYIDIFSTHVISAGMVTLGAKTLIILMRMHCSVVFGLSAP